MENGWASESYTVKTSDNYVSQLFRIPGKIGEDRSKKKPAVLMMHGIECNSMFYMLNTVDKNPAWIMAEQGYDVWLGNNRGNNFAIYNTELSHKDKEFWDFSWEEMGTHDTPAFIDFILGKTGLKNLTYIGHSEGTT